MTCNAGTLFAIGLNLISLAVNTALSIRAIRSWNRANAALDLAIKARAEAIYDLIKRADECSTTTTLN